MNIILSIVFITRLSSVYYVSCLSLMFVSVSHNKLDSLIENLLQLMAAESLLVRLAGSFWPHWLISLKSLFYAWHKVTLSRAQGSWLVSDQCSCHFHTQYPRCVLATRCAPTMLVLKLVVVWGTAGQQSVCPIGQQKAGLKSWYRWYDVNFKHTHTQPLTSTTTISLFHL